MGFCLFPPASHTFVMNHHELPGSAGWVCTLIWWCQIFLYISLTQITFCCCGNGTF